VAQAQAAGVEGGVTAQSPLQVIVQIILAAIVLRAVNSFNLP